jgi:hypothetical protein
MAELSFLTIIVSLAVCSLLIYAVFQYTKIRLTILEQSQKEQALILQQFIEESSTDIHRLYQLSTNNNGGGRGGGNLQPHDSIILEYANDFANHDVSYTKPVTAYNEPHIIHLDTALFKNNNKSNLIEISSDSEDTTDSGSESDSGSEGSDSEGSETGIEGSDSESSDSSESSDGDEEPMIHEVISEVIEVVCDPEPISDIKLVTVDLGAIQESLPSHPSSSSPEHKNDVLSMLYKKAQETSSSEVTVTDVQPSDVPDAPAASEPEPVPAPAPAPSLSSMSVPELRHLLKEKYKNNPEKHPEIQKLKKVELIYALQTTQS